MSWLNGLNFEGSGFRNAQPTTSPPRARFHFSANQHQTPNTSSSATRRRLSSHVTPTNSQQRSTNHFQVPRGQSDSLNSHSPYPTRPPNTASRATRCILPATLLLQCNASVKVTLLLLDRFRAAHTTVHNGCCFGRRNVQGDDHGHARPQTHQGGTR